MTLSSIIKNQASIKDQEAIPAVTDLTVFSF